MAGKGALHRNVRGIAAMQPANVLVVIVNYRTPALAVAAAAALEADVRARGDVHVVIVDNASGDGSAEAIAAGIVERGMGGWCTALPVTRNGGFSAGNNAGVNWHVEQTGQYPRYAWLLNPDTVAEPGALGALVDFLDTHPKVGIAGSRCLNPDGTVWPSAFNFMTPASEFNNAIAFAPISRLIGDPIVTPPQPEQAGPTPWVSGTSMMVRRELIEQVGQMDEGYFLYFEETDYCAKAWAGGFEVWTVPASRVTHIGGQSTGVTGAGQALKRRPRYWFASRARFFIHQYGVKRTHIANGLWLAAFPLGRMINRLRGRKSPHPPQLWRDFLMSYYGPRGIMYRPERRARTMGVDS
jgi:N-acetylglucosaminyl-diphospho-decaprenol L-rhamnosyltransferase